MASLFCLVSCSPNQVKEETPKTQASLSALPNTPVANTTPTMEITIDSSIRMEDLMGKIKPSQHPNFVVIARKYASRNGMYLHKAAYQAFQEMHTTAAADGISLTIKSATRPFAAQKIILEGKNCRNVTCYVNLHPSASWFVPDRQIGRFRGSFL